MRLARSVGLVAACTGLLGLTAATAPAEATEGVFKASRSGLTLPLQRAGMFVGRAGTALVIGGGLDAAGAPMSDVLVQPAGSTAWRRFDLPYAVAHAAVASASWAEQGAERGALFVAGGRTAGGPSARVLRLQWENDSLRQAELPPLPAALALAGAAAFADQPQRQLYVVGGTTTGETDGASNRAFRCTLGGEGAPAWEELPRLPGPGRLLPAVVAFYNDVHVFGGCVAESGRCVPTAAASAYRWKPIDGTRFSGWRELAPLPAPLAGAAVFQTGQVHAALAGGTPEPLPAGAAATAGSGRLFVYHNVTDTWVQAGSLPAPIGPASAVALDGRILIAGGGEAWGLELQRTVRTLAAWDYALVIGYFLAVAAIGIWYARRQTSTATYALGDRRVPWWMAGIAMFATGASSISFMAIPAQSFRTSLLWAFPTLVLVPLFVLEAYVIYPLVRRLELTSTFEYLERRFHPALRTIASAQAIALQVFGRMNMVLLLPAVAIAAVTGLDVMKSVLLMGVVTTLYTAKGGLRAVVVTELIQGLTTLAGVTLIIALAIGGLRGGLSDFLATGAQFGKFELANWSLDHTAPIFWLIVLTPILNKLAFAADQPVVQKVFATPLRDVRKLAAMFLFCSVFISFAVNLAGISVFAYFRQHPAQLDPAMTNDQVIPLYIVQRLPTGVAGLIVAALFASAASALAGSMNSVATIFTEDFYRKLRPQAGDRERLLTMRLASVAAGALATGAALLMATRNLRSLFQAWNELFALLGSGFLGVYILGIFTRRTNAIGAASGALASIVVTVLVRSFTTLHWYGYMPTAVLSCCAIGYLVSLLTPAAPRSLAGLTAFDMVDEAAREKAA